MRQRTGRIADEGFRGEEPRFNETEFALILKRAIELDLDWVRPDEAAPPPRLPPEGLTLSEVLAIAGEVGVDPVRVLEAVRSLHAPGWGVLARVFGGPLRMGSERLLARDLAPEEMRELLDVARRVMETEGESHEVLGGVEWKNGSQMAPVVVRLTPGSSGGWITASVERGGSAFLSHWIPVLWGLGLAGITLGVLDITAWQPTLATIAGGLAGGYGVARVIWLRSTRRWERLLDRLTSEMAEAIRPALPGE